MPHPGLLLSAAHRRISAAPCLQSRRIGYDGEICYGCGMIIPANQISNQIKIGNTLVFA